MPPSDDLKAKPATAPSQTSPGVILYGADGKPLPTTTMPDWVRHLEAVFGKEEATASVNVITSDEEMSADEQASMAYSLIRSVNIGYFESIKNGLPVEHWPRSVRRSMGR
jgi:hypothetical protein